MKTISQCDLTVINSFFQTLPSGSRSRRLYGRALRDFQRLSPAPATAKRATLSQVRAWLQAQSRQHSLNTVQHQARWIDRFLQWKQEHRLISSNPFASLRNQYRVRSMVAIVNALLMKNYRHALKGLSPPPRFGSFLGPQMQAEVQRMRALGYRYDSEELDYLRFDRFLQARSDLRGKPIASLIDEWSKCSSSPRAVLDAHQCGRNLSKALHRLDPNQPVLPRTDALRRCAVREQRRPYIFTEKQIARLLRAAQNFPSPRAPWRPLMIYTMTAITYCAGLRVGELAKLTLGDVHLEDESLEVRDTKFFKSRVLPLTPSVMRALKSYLAARAQLGAPRNPKAPLFWNPLRRKGYCLGWIRANLTEVIRSADLKPARGRVGPRVHDLRHSFVLHRLLGWYRAGINPQAHLPYLATYLGHVSISSTLVYLTQTQDLAREANERFRKWAGHLVLVAGEKS